MSDRTCVDCGATHLDAEFQKDKSRRTGYINRCKPCQRERDRAKYRAKHYGGKANLDPRHCLGCGTEFEPTNRKHRWCKQECRSWHKNARRSGKHRLLGRKDCEWCGKTFEVRTDNPEARGCCVSCGMLLSKSAGSTSPVAFVQCKWCEAWRTTRTSHDCTQKPAPPPPIVCHVCSTQIAGAPQHQRYCSSICKDIAHGRDSRRIWVNDCAWCGTIYVARLKLSRYCSPRCADQSTRNRRGRFVVPDTLRFAIYERDRWVCQLCGKRVGRSYPTNHRRAPSLDHIIPRSLGGPDEPGNLQLAHRVCNSLKHNGTYAAAEQLALNALVGA